MKIRDLVRTFSAGGFCLILCACGSSPSTTQMLAEPVRALPDDGTDHLLTLMNEARRKKRRPLLNIDPRLNLATKDHSNSMHEHNYFAHLGRDDSNFQVRLARRGYPLSHSAENLAKARDAQTVFQMWWDSKGHKVNMMNKKYTRVGIARTGEYWTANYAAPDGT